MSFHYIKLPVFLEIIDSSSMRKLLQELELAKKKTFLFSILHLGELSTMPNYYKVLMCLLFSKKLAIWAGYKVWTVSLIGGMELNRFLKTMTSLNLSTWRRIKGVSFLKCKSTFWPKLKELDPYFHFLTTHKILRSSNKILSPTWLNIWVRHWWKSFTVYFKEKICICESDIRSISKYTGKLKITYTLPMSSHNF